MMIYDLSKYERYVVYSKQGLTPTQIELALKKDFILFEEDFRENLSVSIVCILITNNPIIGIVLYQLIQQYTAYSQASIRRYSTGMFSKKGHSWVSYIGFGIICESSLHIDQNTYKTAINYLELINMIVRSDTYIRPHWTIFVTVFDEEIEDEIDFSILDYKHTKKEWEQSMERSNELKSKELIKMRRNGKSLSLINGLSTPTFKK